MCVKHKTNFAFSLCVKLKGIEIKILLLSAVKISQMLMRCQTGEGKCKNEWIEKNEYPYYDNGSERLHPIPKPGGLDLDTQLV